MVVREVEVGSRHTLLKKSNNQIIPKTTGPDT